MPEYYNLKATPERARKIVRATDLVLARYENERPPLFGAPEWVGLGFINEHGTAVPAYGCMLITGMELNFGIMNVTQSDSYGAQYLHLLNSESAIEPDGKGVSAGRWPAWALCDTDADGLPAVGEFWGPVEDSWKLRKYVGGFQVVGIPGTADTDHAGLARVIPAPMLIFVGKTDAAHNKSTTGTVSIWHGVLGSESDSTYNMTGVYNRFANISSGKWVEAYYRNGNWEEIAAEC